jgi:hypothetical protein
LIRRRLIGNRLRWVPAGRRVISEIRKAAGLKPDRVKRQERSRIGRVGRRLRARWHREVCQRSEEAARAGVGRRVCGNHFRDAAPHAVRGGLERVVGLRARSQHSSYGVAEQAVGGGGRHIVERDGCGGWKLAGRIQRERERRGRDVLKSERVGGRKDWWRPGQCADAACRDERPIGRERVRPRRRGLIGGAEGGGARLRVWDRRVRCRGWCRHVRIVGRDGFWVRGNEPIIRKAVLVVDAVRAGGDEWGIRVRRHQVTELC